VHRDLKLENLLLDDSFVLKVADFSLSTQVESFETLLTDYVGTEGY
jgi:serine/threonine protein kinase